MLWILIRSASVRLMKTLSVLIRIISPRCMKTYVIGTHYKCLTKLHENICCGYFLEVLQEVHENICCGYSLEEAHQDASKHMLWELFRSASGGA